MESLQKDELEKEQSLNRELHSRLMEKENQLNIYFNPTNVRPP